jgi:hemolysin-activating ACP:hemolysin acyltransferase
MAFWSKNSKGKQPPAMPAPQLVDLAPEPEPIVLPELAPPIAAAVSAPPRPAVLPRPQNGAAPAPGVPANEFRPNERFAMEFGKIAVVLLASPRHKALPLGDVFAQLMPCIAANQYVVAGAKLEGRDVADPIAVVMWACVSDEVDSRMSGLAAAPVALAQHEWSCGPHIWIIDAIGPAKVIEAMISQLAAGPLKDRPVKLRRRNPQGQITVDTWPIAAAPVS